MEVTISLDGVLTDEQMKRIRQQLSGLAPKPLEAFCAAAIAESADVIFSRRSEPATLAAQNRLYRLIKHAFGGKIPTERFVSAFFGITEQRAMNMLSAISKRYGDELKHGWSESAKSSFSGKEVVKIDGVTWYRFSGPPSLIDYLKEIVASASGGRLAPIRKVSGTAERYEIKKDTHDAVCKQLGI